MPSIDKAVWDELSPQLDALLEADATQRREILACLARADPEAAATLTYLLALERSDECAAIHTLSDSTSTSTQWTSGAIIGSYMLERLLGRGGMGSVWLARERTGDAAPVAIKLPHATLGPEARARFARERGALARLKHPHIARLIDSGTTPERQPYLVLEYVEGDTIDVYCDQRNLDVRARVRLFMDVLTAVAHAHAQLILHRDLKPANTLVTAQGGVKLLDFGIAKLLPDGELTSPTELTRFAGRPFTPEYAAPEVINNGDLTVASDVYSLGVMLYVLLVGSHPTAIAVGSHAERMRALIEREPERLGQRARSVDPARAAQRSAAPAQLARALDGDLDNIVGMALAKDLDQRYPTVPALAEDLRRYLDNEPVRARPASLGDRAHKFMRRNRLSVALGTSLLLTLVAGLTISLVQAHHAEQMSAEAQRARMHASQAAQRANEQRDFAMLQLARAESVNELNAYLLSDAVPYGDPMRPPELLVKAEGMIDVQGDDANRVEMLIAVGHQYRMQERHGDARRVLERAYGLTSNSSDAALRAKASCALADAVALAGAFERAALLLQAADTLPELPNFLPQRIFCLLRAGNVARLRGEPEREIAYMQSAQSLQRSSSWKSTLNEYRVASNLASAYRAAGRYPEADNMFSQIWSRLVAAGHAEGRSVSQVLNNWGVVKLSLGQPMAAEGMFRRALASDGADVTAGRYPPNVLSNLARALYMQGRQPEAADAVERAYAVALRLDNRYAIKQSLMLRSEIYRDRGELAAASAVLDEAETWLAGRPPGHTDFATLHMQRALLAQAHGQLGVANAAADAAVLVASESAERKLHLPRNLIARSSIRLSAGRSFEAEADARRALEIEQTLTGQLAPSSFIGQAALNLALALEAQGEHSLAKEALVQAREALQGSLPPTHPSVESATESCSLRPWQG